MEDDVMTEAGPKGKGKGKGKAAKAAKAEGGKTAETQIARMLVRALWQQEWSAANPDKAPADRTAAWKEARQSTNETQLKAMRRAVMSLKRSGVTMTVSDKAAKVAESDDMPMEDAAEE